MQLVGDKTSKPIQWNRIHQKIFHVKIQMQKTSMVTLEAKVRSPIKDNHKLARIFTWIGMFTGGGVGCHDPLLYLDKEVEYTTIKLAPGEASKPIPFFQDADAEEMSFPTIYCGAKRQLKVKATYTDKAKSEIRRFDRRACNSSHLLFAFKKSLTEKVYNALQICLRQRSGSTKITAKETKTPGYLQNLIEKDDGYAVFQNIRSSPCYWKKQQKRVNGMIRQLGRPQLFITLSAAETRWNELLKILMKVVKNKSITEEEAKALTFLEKAELIQKDPVTCMLHFDHRMRQLLNVILNKEGGIFHPYKLMDYFTRIEFQMRGSPHSHGVYWIKDAPIYKGVFHVKIII